MSVFVSVVPAMAIFSMVIFVQAKQNESENEIGHDNDNENNNEN